jgi:hypothetical protein
MCDLAVVALEEVLADDLPVRLELRLPAGVVHEPVDIEAELCDLSPHRTECVRQRLGVPARVHERERSPRVGGDAAETEACLVEVGLFFGPRRRAQRAVEAVGPGVVGALDRLAFPRALDEGEAAVPADVEERSQLAVVSRRRATGGLRASR